MVGCSSFLRCSLQCQEAESSVERALGIHRVNRSFAQESAVYVSE